MVSLRSLFFVSVFFFVGTVLLIDNKFIQIVQADSISRVSAERSVSVAAQEILTSIKGDNSVDIADLDGVQNCPDNKWTMYGKNMYGAYEISFLDASGSEVSCSESASSVTLIRGVGYSGGESVAISFPVSSMSTARSDGDVPNDSGDTTNDDTRGGDNDDDVDEDDTTDSSSDCSSYTVGSSVPDGYGPPFNALSAEQEVILTVLCGSEDNAYAYAGSDIIQTLVYNKGLVYSDGSWREVSFSGTSASGNPGWLSKKATSSALPISRNSRQNFIVAFICLFHQGEWKCGCRDGACERNHWTIQAYSRP